MIMRRVWPLLLVMLIGATPPGQATTPAAGIHLAATKSGCGLVDVPSATRLDLAAALGPADSGFTVLYVAQLGSDPMDLLVVRETSTAPSPDSRRGVLLGASASTFPAGAYRVCAFADHPRALTIPASGLRASLSVRPRPVASSALRVSGNNSPGPMVENRATTPVSTSSTSLVVVTGVLRYNASLAGTFDATTCLVARDGDCANGKLFGTGNRVVNGGAGTESHAQYWVDGEAGPGAFEAGFLYRGTIRPEAVRSFVLSARL